MSELHQREAASYELVVGVRAVWWRPQRVELRGVAVKPKGEEPFWDGGWREGGGSSVAGIRIGGRGILAAAVVVKDELV